MPPGGMRLRFTTNHDETAWDNPPVTIFGGPAGARAAYVAMTLLPGRPLLYNGQEIESPLKLRLFERDPIAWDIPGATEAVTFYRKVLDLARTHPAFLAGTFREIGTSAPDDVIAYQRDRVLVLVNARPNAVALTVTGLAVDGSRDLLSNHTQAGNAIVLPAYGTAVLELGRR
jgi:glycosidase